MSQLSPTEAAALRRALAQRLTAATHDKINRRWLTSWLDETPDSALPDAARVVRAALAARPAAGRRRRQGSPAVPHPAGCHRHLDARGDPHRQVDRG